MSKRPTHKRTPEGRRETLARKAARRRKAGPSFDVLALCAEIGAVAR